MEDNENGATFTLWFTIFAATVGSSFVFGYNVGVMNAPAKVIKCWIQNTSYPTVHNVDLDEYTLIEIWSWIVSIFILAGAIGGLLCGYMADKLGRKKAMMVNDFITIFGAVLMGISKLTNAYWLLIIGRFIMGISCGISSGLGPMYLTELAPLRLRGILGSANSLVVIFGFFISQVLSLPHLLGSQELWPTLVAFSGIPALIQLLFLPFCPESPKYLLIIRRKQTAAGDAVVRLRNSKNVVWEVNSLLAETVKPLPVDEPGTKQTSTRLFLWGLIICISLHISQQLSGANAVVYFSATIFEENARMDPEQAIGANLGVGATFVLGSLVSTLLMDKVGRRVLMLAGLTGAFISDIMIFACLHLLAMDQYKYQAAAYGAAVFVYAIIFSFAVGPASIPWFYVSELFSPSQRGKANTIAATSGWIFQFVLGYTFLPLKESMNEFVFLLFAGSVAFCIIFLYFFTPETKARQNSDIEKELIDRMPVCCRQSKV